MKFPPDRPRSQYFLNIMLYIYFKYLKPFLLASSIYVSGQYLSTALFTGALLWLATAYSWHYIFFATGAVGVVFGIAWLYLYRDPLNCKKVSKEELQYIEDGGGLVFLRENGP